MNSSSFEIQGNIVDVVAKRIFKGTVVVSEGKIESIIEEPVTEDGFILPGLIDAHIHVESSMLIPSEFARLRWSMEQSEQFPIPTKLPMCWVLQG